MIDEKSFGLIHFILVPLGKSLNLHGKTQCPYNNVRINIKQNNLLPSN
jgi:hypothetical protein